MIYRIAELTVEMEPSGRTRAQAEPYRAPAWVGAPDLTVRVDPRQALTWVPEALTEDEAEYLVSGDMFNVGLLHFGGLMLHSSAVVYSGRTVCFSAPPGTGKSTHAEKWVRLFGAAILNDDKPALRRTADGWTVYGTPWSGKEDLSRCDAAPLHAICFLQRGAENRVEPLTPAQALPRLLSQTTRRIGREDMLRLLPLCDALLREVPAWLMTCRNDDDAAFVAKRALYS